MNVLSNPDTHRKRSTHLCIAVNQVAGLCVIQQTSRSGRLR
jgi:hypothetical protein